MRAAEIHAEWESLPFGDIDTIFGQGRTLILAPHPDDESLGCGGLIARSCRIDRPPLVVILTDGTGSHPSMPSLALGRLRQHEAMEALRQLGSKDPDDLVFLGLRDTAAPHHGPDFDAAVEHLARLAAECGSICAPWRHDPHSDHLAAALMAEEVAARTGIRSLFYPVWGWTLPSETELPWVPGGGWRLDITDARLAKQRAIAAHRSQHGDLITDDPAGFQLPAQLLRTFQRPYEVYLTPC